MAVVSKTDIRIPKYFKLSRTQEKKTFHIEEAWLRKNILLGDLFDDDLYLLCVISIFATFVFRFISDPKQYRKKLGYHFQQVLHKYLHN